MQLAKNAGLFTIGVAPTVNPELLKKQVLDLVLAKIGDELDSYRPS
ncbi:hypothetical protein [Methanosarcina sp. UBA5]|nr:hypothetical protein [Methanosarcina sp. UBA5]